MISRAAYSLVRLAATQAERNNFRTAGGYTIGNVD